VKVTVPPNGSAVWSNRDATPRDKGPSPVSPLEVRAARAGADAGSEHEPSYGVGDLLERIGQAERRDRIAIVDDLTTITFGALSDRCSRFSAGLVRAGVTAGDRVMLCLLDTIDWPTAFMGTLQAGATPVCPDTRLDAAVYEALLRETEARLLVVSRSLYPAFDGLLQRVDSLARVAVSEAPLADGGDIAVLLSLDEEAEPPPRPRRSVSCRLSDGVRSHAWFDAVAGSSLARGAPVALEPGDRCLSSGRLCEPAMLEHMMLPALAVGATLVLIAEESGPAAWRARLRGERPDHLEGRTPTLLFASSEALEMMVAGGVLPGAGNSGLRAAVIVAGAADDAVVQAFTVRTGARLVTAAPMSDLTPIADDDAVTGAVPLHKLSRDLEQSPEDDGAHDGDSDGGGAGLEADDGAEPGTAGTTPPRDPAKVAVIGAFVHPAAAADGIGSARAVPLDDGSGERAEGPPR
jgi:hypothetical protein